MKKRGHAVACISFSFRFINFFVNLWPILTFCVADMVHAVAAWFVADIVVSPDSNVILLVAATAENDAR